MQAITLEGRDLEPPRETRMRISVVIPAYNEASRIEPTVCGALLYADEVIVVDDGSQDNTGRVAEALGVRVVRQANGGYLSAIKPGPRVKLRLPASVP